jgi:hypothetical protein
MATRGAETVGSDEGGRAGMGAAIYGAVMGLLAILGLFVAARAHDGAIHLAGFLLFLFGVINIFALIHKLTEPPRGGT